MKLIKIYGMENLSMWIKRHIWPIEMVYADLASTRKEDALRWSEYK